MGARRTAGGAGLLPPGTSDALAMARQRGRALALRGDADHVPGQPADLEPADDQCRRIELPAAEAVARRGREGVVVVVPGLAEGRRARARARLRDSSPVSKRRLPKTWQSELML